MYMQNNITIEQDKNYLIDTLNKAGIYIKFDEEQELVYLNNFVISYLSKTAVVQNITSLLLDFHYYFQADTDRPLILDVGSEVGTSIIFFKILYPNARIIAFEPHPLAYKKIIENVTRNNLTDVKVINAAVAKEEGETFLYGDANYVNGECNVLGCSVIETWGQQRPFYDTMPIKSVQLSQYINEPIDLLKLDVEGAEYGVFENLEQQNKFQYIKNLVMEIHQWDNTSTEGLLKTLKDNHFIDVGIIGLSNHANFPEDKQAWLKKHDIKISILKANKVVDKVDICSNDLLLKKLFYVNCFNKYLFPPKITQNF